MSVAAVVCPSDTVPLSTPCVVYFGTFPFVVDAEKLVRFAAALGFGRHPALEGERG